LRMDGFDWTGKHGQSNPTGPETLTLETPPDDCALDEGAGERRADEEAG
jgi:hypothetical protein